MEILESKFGHSPMTLKIGEGQQKIKIVHSNQQSNLWVSCQSNFSLPWLLPTHEAITRVCQFAVVQGHVFFSRPPFVPFTVVPYRMGG